MKTNAGSGPATDASPRAAPTTRADPLPTDVDSLPDLPAAFHDALDGALGDLHVSLSPRARSAIEAHVRLLLAWTIHVNLTAIREPTAVAIDHVADSLSALAVLDEEGAGSLIDIGSGGGFPGMPLLAASGGSGAVVDSIAKKARFLEAAVGAMGLGSNVEVVRERAEVLARAPQHRERWPIVTARAVGSLAAVAALGLPLLATGGLLVAWKRSPIEEEMAAAGSVVARLGGGDVRWRPSGLADRPSNVLVTVRKVRPAADAGGRDGAHGRRVRRSGRRLG